MSTRLLVKNFIHSFETLNLCQKEVVLELKKYDFFNDISINCSSINFITSFRKNFFTLLMLTLINESKISSSRTISYGKIIIFLRQIVTSVDNILDNEKKGNIFIPSLNNPLVENSFISLIFQDLLTKEIFKLSPENQKAHLILNESIYSIAKGESIRKREMYREYPSSNFIIENIHKYIGGKLLEISLIIPNLLENNPKITQFSEGLFTIGMSLQALDDFFDIDEDLKNGDINLAIAKYLEEFKIDEKNIEFKNINIDFIEKYLADTINIAYDGFFKLQNAGFPINSKEIKFILKKLFILRGLKGYTHYIK